VELKIVFLVILLAIGAIQGFVFGFALWKSTTIHKLANRFLAAILFFFSYRLTVEIFHFFGLGRYDTWYYIFLEFNWIYGALIYFFVRSYTNPNFRWKPQYWFHFLPVIIEIIWSFFIKTQNLYWDGTRESLSWLGYYGYIAWMHYPIMYVLSGALILGYSYTSLKILRTPTSLEGYQSIPGKLKWIKRVVFVLAIFSLIFTLTTLVDFLFFDYAFNFFGYPIFASMAIITYWLGIEGFSLRKEEAFKEITKISAEERLQLERIAGDLQRLMQSDALYKNPELTLTTLSRKLDTKPYLLTKSHNIILKKKFTDYVNELRIEEVKRLLENPKNEQYTLLALAYDAGFNSKASFNRAVKKSTGKSPSALKSTFY
jgi:AraC-like DNA-binding protein